MAATADTWHERPGGGGGRRGRVLAAFALSLACHALALASVRGWRVAEPMPARLLVVTIEAGGGEASGKEPAGAAGAGGESVPGPAAAASSAPVAPPVAERPRPAAARPPARDAAPLSRLAARRPAAVVGTPPVAVDARPAVAAPSAAVDARPAAADTPPAAGDAPAAAAPVTTGLTAAAGHAGAGLGGAAAASGGAAGAAGAGSGPGRGTGGGEGAGGDGLRVFCASCPAPDYPARARRQGWQGTVDVALAIGGDGSVTDARVGRSSGYPALDEVALEVARRSRFRVPASGAGLRGQLRYRFLLDATAARR